MHIGNSLPQIDSTQFFNSLPYALILLDAEKNIFAVNSAFNRLYESSDLAMQEKFLDSLFEPNKNYTRFMEESLPATGILWLRQLSGNKIKVVAQHSEFLSVDGVSSILSIYAFAQEGLGSHFVAGITNDGCWVWDVLKSTTWRSPRWLEIAGMTHEPATVDTDDVSKRFEFINASEGRDAVKKKFMEDTGLAEGEGYLKCLDGTRKHISWQGLVIARNAKGEPLLSMGSIRDMAPFLERNVTISKARENVTHQARLLQLGETLAAVSHELNQPLSAIASYASVFKRGINPNSENGKLIYEIETQALRAGTLLRRIRNFARRNTDDVRKDISIIPVLSDVIEWMKTDWRCRDMRFNLSVSADVDLNVCKIKCHRIEIEQIIINLITNAAFAIRSMEVTRYISDDFDIEISVASMDLLEITVADRGPGVSSDLSETIFTPFTTTRIDGLGLGLSISTTIANELGGTLRYSPRNGGGALFILSLPFAQSNELDSGHVIL